MSFPRFSNFWGGDRSKIVEISPEPRGGVLFSEIAKGIYALPLARMHGSIWRARI